MVPIDFFYRSAQAYPEAIALKTETVSISYDSLRAQVDALAVALQTIDANPGSRVVLCAANCLEYVVGMLAIMAAGKVWVPVNYRSTAPQVRRIVESVMPTVALVDGDRASLFEDLPPCLLSLVDYPSIIASHHGQQPDRHEFSPDDTHAIKFTGGTTGLPKGVMQPYRAWMANIMNQVAGWSLTADDCFVAAAPLSHGAGTYVLPLLAQGGSLYVADTSLSSVLEAFRHHGGSLTFMPPTLIYKLMEADEVSPACFPDLRLLIYGGAAMPVEKIQASQEFFGPVVATTYGQTEAPQIATLLTPEALMQARYRGSVGRASWLTTIKIVSPNGETLPAGDNGEILIHGDLVMTGYWRRPDLTAETLKNGWLHTGDVGYLDERGFLFIKERLRDVIISGGFNVYPVDVEGCLSTHDAVHEAAVFGLADEKWGEAVNAAVELKAGATVTPDTLKQYVRDRLGPVMTPKNIFIIESLPRSSVGKILKSDLRVMLADTPAS